MAQAMKLKIGNSARKFVLIKLADNANDNGECWPSYQHIADHCELGRSTVKGHIQALKEDGFLRVEERNGGNSSNKFILTLDSGRQKERAKPKRKNSNNIKPGQSQTRSTADPSVSQPLTPGQSLTGSTADLPRSTADPSVPQPLTPEPIIEPTNEPINEYIRANDKKSASKNSAKYSLEELKSFDLSNWPSLPTDQDLTDWLEIRKSKRSLVTQRVVTDMGRELAKAQQQFNLTIPQIFEAILTGNPWAGFRASYLENYTTPGVSNEFSSRNRPRNQPFIPDNESTDWLDEAKRQQQEWDAMWAGREHAGRSDGHSAGSDEGCRPDELPVQPDSGDFHEASGGLARPIIGECGQAGVVIDHEG